MSISSNLNVTGKAFGCRSLHRLSTMLDDYSLILTIFLLALVVVPAISILCRNDLRKTAVKSAVVNGLVTVVLLLQYGHLLYIASFAPHHSAWTSDSNYVRLDCYESQKGGKLPDDFRDCLLGQADVCSIDEPCTPCPAGGDAVSTNTDFHASILNYSDFLCRNCSYPYRSHYNCQYSDDFGPYCLVDDTAPTVYTGTSCHSKVAELARSPEVQLPFYLLEQFDFLDSELLNESSIAELSRQFAYSHPISSTHACERCCTRMWDEDDLIPDLPTINPNGGGFTRYVSVEFVGSGVYYTLDGTDPDPCLGNGHWYFEPVELTEIGSTLLTAVATFRGHKSAVVQATFDITDCSDEWFLEMSSEYVFCRVE